MIVTHFPKNLKSFTYLETDLQSTFEPNSVNTLKIDDSYFFRLPPVTGNEGAVVVVIVDSDCDPFIKSNRDANDIMDGTSKVNTLTLAPGKAVMFVCNKDNWVLLK